MNDEQVELATPTTSIINVGPERAAEWLAENNTHNRAIREAQVSRYARDMADGQWQFNGDPIRFATDGTLLDGQHRLSAILRSGVTVPMVVIWGLPSIAQETMDIGSVRSMADALLLRGETGSKYMAAIARRCLLFDQGINTVGGYASPSYAEMHSYIDANPSIRRAVEVAQRSQSNRIPASPSTIGSAFFVCARRDVPSAELFYITQLIDSVGLRIGDPAHTLQLRLRKEAGEGRQMHADDVFRYCILAWNAFRAGRELKKLQAPHGGWGASNMPVPR